MKSIFIFSGLGVDERVFVNLNFGLHKITFIKWIKPFRNETLEHYAGRLLSQIHAPNPILIGLSFGGMLAVEIGKLIPTEKIILIASSKSKLEIPFYYKIAGRLFLHKIIPARFLKMPNALTNWFFGIKSREDQKLLASILNDTNPYFFKWALSAILSWQNHDNCLKVVHIHGTSDRILPIQFVKPDFQIKNGGHFMTMNKSEEINALLEELLK